MTGLLLSHFPEMVHLDNLVVTGLQPRKHYSSGEDWLNDRSKLYALAMLKSKKSILLTNDVETAANVGCDAFCLVKQTADAFNDVLPLEYEYYKAHLGGRLENDEWSRRCVWNWNSLVGAAQVKNGRDAIASLEA
jgi:hypothetical protein